MVAWITEQEFLVTIHSPQEGSFMPINVLCLHVSISFWRGCRHPNAVNLWKLPTHGILSGNVPFESNRFLCLGLSNIDLSPGVVQITMDGTEPLLGGMQSVEELFGRAGLQFIEIG